jgi:thiamine-phosphate pyrophosphorylase
MHKWYYISQEDHLQNIQNVCEAGVRLIQLRVKNVAFQQYQEIANQAKEICKQYNTQLIINDNVLLAKSIQANGVHLGQNDMSPLEARKLLSSNSIIGGTANTYKDCIHLIQQKVDYIGLGPYKFTTTKKNLSPILGLDGYQNIVSQLRNEGYSTPIYAIGGITENDFENLFKTNINGIAISGLISNQTPQNIKQILRIADLTMSNKSF